MGDVEILLFFGPAHEEAGMSGNVARLHAPFQDAVGREAEQFAARHIVLGIHDVEVLIDWIHDNAVRQAYLAHLWRGAQMVSHLLMSPHVYYTITYGVALKYLAPGRADIIQGVTNDTHIAD